MQFISLFLLCVIATTASLASANTGTREVVLDNADVEVVRLAYPAGAESGMHTHVHPNRVVYFIKGGVLELVPQDTSQPPRVLTVTDGQTLYLPATSHNVKNIGNTEVVIVETEIKATKDKKVNENN